jgi:carbamoyl-phosphate synthase small subunit
MSPTTAGENACVLLEDGTLFRGVAFGKRGVAAGEICFNTGMTGYQEVFTDPSYYGQVLIMNCAHIGNYGVSAPDDESSGAKVRAVIGRNLGLHYSRNSAAHSLESYFEQEGIVGITEIDTRALVAHVRTRGAMNCLVCTDDTPFDSLLSRLKAAPNMAGQELASSVSTKTPYDRGEPHADIRIAVLDYGVKRSILRNFTDRGALVRVFPARAQMKELEAFHPDGYFLSNGPGDPASMDYAVDLIGGLLETGKPLFGICLGHQLLARSIGIPTFKMHHGHRGLNHPVKHLLTGRSEITTQNHGFGVDAEAVKASDQAEITHVNLNDGSVEGIRLRNRPAFSVQYHPEAAPGPHDSRYLFDDFISRMRPGFS